MPRHKPRTGWGEDRIDFKVVTREADCWDCWTLVLRRSAGWRRMELVSPDDRPARKWNIVFDAV